MSQLLPIITTYAPDTIILARWGFVPEDNLVGRANIIFFSIGGGASPLEVWKWPSYIRPARFFTSIE